MLKCTRINQKWISNRASRYFSSFDNFINLLLLLMVVFSLYVKICHASFKSWLQHWIVVTQSADIMYHFVFIHVRVCRRLSGASFSTIFLTNILIVVSHTFKITHNSLFYTFSVYIITIVFTSVGNPWL